MRVWIDLDNTPHVPFFKPIGRELEKRGHEVIFTARDAFQVCELAARSGVPYKRIGRHYGKNRFLKVGGLLWRSLQLLPFTVQKRPQMALSHGARSQILLSNVLRIPTVMIMDYEHAETPWLLRPRWEIVPEVLLNERLHCRNRDRVRTYPGIKEDVYAPSFTPDPAILEELGLRPDQLLVTVRPPANEAHYHNPESEALFEAFMQRLCSAPAVRAVLLPRNKQQEAHLRQTQPAWFQNGKVIVPRAAVDGLNLVWHSDLVVSGGGTMNREAAALGVPVYSVFRGKMGAVDRQLVRERRLTMIERVADVHEKISLSARMKDRTGAPKESPALEQILARLAEIARAEQIA